MSFMKTRAYIRGSWDGVPGESNFTQNETEYTSVVNFYDYKNDDIEEVLAEYLMSGDLINRVKEMSVDGKVLISTKDYIDEAAYVAFSADPRWSGEEAVSKGYDVEEAPTPEDVNTFNEGSRIYYHSSAHLL